ncbi:prolipoprotein diacylglyceryl transferase [Christiangramia gaetbulicola]|uniref:Phosphatidylglycerol--prolipoprotein diacylglyceryl transferase n=1 Tax=Christiangramia gaetbulicola TaxID=703340 RepID=A0A2T6AE30_9FLAO|nr:prolipoprotein diacylglyceryl transferase [Christiangramia gaetbulicola]PTX42071.1 prolipoprotein diacylglyceryl transferase [Christiangramia gaetbulicola]
MLLNAIRWNPSEGLDLGFFTLHYYSLMFLIAFTLGWYIMKAIYTRENISVEKLDSLFIYTVLATLIGARLGHVIFYDWEYFQNHLLEIFLPVRFEPEFEFTGFRGLASHGAAIGIIIAMYLYSKRIIEKPVLWILDRIVIPVASGAIFVRIGNFINSEIIGKPTNSDYGIIFEKLGEDFPRHPAQLYESACYLAIFIILWFLYWKTEKRFKSGYLFGLFLVLLWTVRFFIEFIKEPQVGERANWLLNTGQWLSIPFVIAGLYFMYRPVKRKTV